MVFHEGQLHVMVGVMVEEVHKRNHHCPLEEVTVRCIREAVAHHQGNGLLIQVLGMEVWSAGEWVQKCGSMLPLGGRGEGEGGGRGREGGGGGKGEGEGRGRGREGGGRGRVGAMYIIRHWVGIIHVFN